MTSAATSQETEISKKSKSSEIARAVNLFKTITVTENDARKGYYKEKLKKFPNNRPQRKKM